MIDFIDFIEIVFGAVYQIATTNFILPNPVGSTNALEILLFLGFLNLMVWIVVFLINGFLNQESGGNDDD
jgi:hypothetical protein